jgi:uncharacterized membrane protein
VVRFGPSARAGLVFGFGLGGLADGIVLHQILRWHHLVSDDVEVTTVSGLQKNILADGIFHAATVLIVVVGAVLLRRTSGRGPDRSVVGGSLTGWGAFHVADEIVFHALLDLHHIRMVENYLVYDLAFTAVGVTLIGVGLSLVNRSEAVRS